LFRSNPPGEEVYKKEDENHGASESGEASMSAESVDVSVCR
jgi:hypothetical protein